MPKVGTKFRVVHKFGGRRKKRKTAVQSTEKPEHQLTKKASATSAATAGALPTGTATDTDGNVPSTSSGLHSTVASKRKLSLFKSQKSSSGSDSDSSEEQVTMEEGAEIDTPTQDMNMIVNLGCLQSIISTLPCPECNQTSQQIKRPNTNFTAPAAKEQKSSRPKSEAIQKLLDEKEKEERQKREAKDKEKRRREKAREEKEKEDKRKNTFRIPKKAAPQDPPSDAESFSSISSGDEAQINSGTAEKHSGHHRKSSSQHADGEKSRKSSSHDHSGSSAPKSSHSDKSHKSLSSSNDQSSSAHKSSSSSGHSHSGEKSHKPSSSSSNGHSGSADKSSSGQSHSGEKSHKSSSSSSNGHSGSADKSSSGQSHSGEKSHKSSSSSSSNGHSGSAHKSSSGHSHSGEKSHKSSSSSLEQSEKKEKHSHPSSERSSSSSHSTSKHKSGEHSSKGGGHHHSETDKSKHHSDKPHKHSSEKRESSSSSRTHGSSDKDKSHSSSNGSGSHSKEKSHKDHHHKEHKEKRTVIEDKAAVVAENDSIGYITSPDISSEEEEAEPSAPTSKAPSSKSRSSSSGSKQCTKSAEGKKRSNSTDDKQEGGDLPVTLKRHHLKPVLERSGGDMDERIKVLEKLQAIRERMAANEPPPSRKRASWGEVKKRRARREKLDGDFTGSCMNKVDYDDEEKPSLKRPEPKPEDMYEQARKEKRRKKQKYVSDKPERSSDAKGSGKSNRFDAKRDKPKFKPKPRPRPPPVNFADLMKMAEQKQVEPVIVKPAPKKEKELRPMTQEEIDRKRTREERLKAKDYQDWYKYGDGANGKKEGKPDRAEPSSGGGFLRPDHTVVPPTASKSFSIPRKGEPPTPSGGGGAAKPDRPPSASGRPSSDSQKQSSGRPSMPVPKPHPTRPGMIANKPQAMAQHLNGQHSKPEASRSSSGGAEEKPKKPSSSAAASREPSSPPPRPKASGKGSADRARQGGNAWDTLFARPEYKKMTEGPAPKKRKMVIDSDEDDDEDSEEDMDDFIDDEGQEDLSSVSSVIQQMFGYDRRKYKDEDDDDRNMEVGFSELMKEEARSARLGLKEDLEDMRQEEEEKRQKALKRKKMRK